MFLLASMRRMLYKRGYSLVKRRPIIYSLSSFEIDITVPLLHNRKHVAHTRRALTLTY